MDTTDAPAMLVRSRAMQGRVSLRTEPISLQSKLLMSIALPLLMRKDHNLDRFRKKVARNQAAGPAEPPARLRRRLGIVRTRLADMDCFRVRPKVGYQPGRRIMYLHGGAYVFEMIAPQWTLVAGMAEQAGAEVIIPAYPLAPDHDVLYGLGKVHSAWLQLIDDGSPPPALAGDSAGAGLALALAHKLRDEVEVLPRALLLLFPWLDVTLSDPEQDGVLEKTDVTLSNAVLREAGRLWAGGLSPSDPRPSPLYGHQTGLPPVLALAGGRDVLVADARRFARCCPEALVREYPGMFHGWICVGTPEGKAALEEAAEFLRRHFD